MNKSQVRASATQTATASADIPIDGIDGVASALACRETARLLRRMLARLPWSLLPYAERQRLIGTIKNLSSDLSLALLILERNQHS